MAKNNGTVVKKRKTMNVRKINNIKMESSHVLMWEKKLMKEQRVFLVRLLLAIYRTGERKIQIKCKFKKEKN